jgi:ribokinase
MTGEGCITVPAFDVRTVDTTGAGDAFCGALASAVAAGIGLQRAVLIGAAAGACSTTTIGARSAMSVEGVLRLVATRDEPKGSDTGADAEFDEAPG